MFDEHNFNAANDGYSANDSDVEPLMLSDEALAALKEFYQEEQKKDAEFNKVKMAASSLDDTSNDSQNHLEPTKITIDVFREDWQLSQFWYTNETAEFIANFARNNKRDGLIFFLSCPTAFVKYMVCTIFSPY
ncbi:hypothetical protein BB561_004438 [Smittium simulii]|uniref:Protein-lysine N-methyltransferase EFM5 n=1 Tax=Smittium simulii TaxID=133385 RepID=A0A2T9YG96_9FUNG|nr:hypothetical protein BB561_004438 [Smittium simulii]